MIIQLLLSSGIAKKDNASLTGRPAAIAEGKKRQN